MKFNLFRNGGFCLPAEITFLFLVIGISILFLVLIVRSVKKEVSGLKIMLLGINISIVGGVVVLDNKLSLGVFGYLIVIGGLVLSFIGSNKRD